jgi:hypothetical protein
MKYTTLVPKYKQVKILVIPESRGVTARWEADV